MLKKFLKKLIIRIYALALLLLVTWAVYMAVAYLFKSVFLGNKVPPEYVNWQAHVTSQLLLSPKKQTILAEGTRPPLSHYHTLARQFQIDTHNGCIASGCHSAIPHSKSAAIRSFNNFHASFLACQMCHEETKTKPMPAKWVSTAAGQIQDPPAILQLMGLMETTKDKTTISPTIVELLKKTLETIGDDPLLRYLMLQIDTSEPGSPIWKKAIDQLKAELPLHLRGEYGAKIAPQATAENYVQIGKKLTSLSKKRDDIYSQIHANITKTPAVCLDCHQTESSLVDFKSLGYSDVHIQMLSTSPVARQMQQIQQGQPFYLPRLLEEKK